MVFIVTLVIKIHLNHAFAADTFQTNAPIVTPSMEAVYLQTVYHPFFTHPRVLMSDQLIPLFTQSHVGTEGCL